MARAANFKRPKTHKKIVVYVPRHFSIGDCEKMFTSCGHAIDAISFRPGILILHEKKK